MPSWHWSCGGLRVCSLPFSSSYRSTHQLIRKKSANVCTSEQILLIARSKILACESRTRNRTETKSDLRTPQDARWKSRASSHSTRHLHLSVEPGDLPQRPVPLVVSAREDKESPYSKPAEFCLKLFAICRNAEVKNGRIKTASSSVPGKGN